MKKVFIVWVTLLFAILCIGIGNEIGQRTEKIRYLEANTNDSPISFGIVQ